LDKKYFLPANEHFGDKMPAALSAAGIMQNKVKV